MFLSSTNLLATLLLIAPCNADEIGIQQPDSSLLTALQEQALELELVDAREVGQVFAYPATFAADLTLVRERFAQLKDAPAVRDGDRFPDREAVNELLAFNYGFRQHLENEKLMRPGRWEEVQLAMQEANRLHQVWELVRDARSDFYHVTVRRQALKQLREMLGDEAYYNGTLPPHVPVWRFHSIN